MRIADTGFDVWQLCETIDNYRTVAKVVADFPLAHLSPTRIGEPLGALGHDVLALASDVRLARLPDRALMHFASEQRRIIVTCDAVDFDLLAREWASTRREHAGLIIAWSLRNSQFKELVDSVRLLVAARPRQRDLKSLVLTL